MTGTIKPAEYAAALLLTATALASAAPATLSSAGWMITADPEARTLSVSHQALGLVFRDARLKIKGTDRARESPAWTASASANKLTILAEDPGLAWVFEPHGNELYVTTSRYDAVIEARVPADNRIPARLLDPQGAPVDWVGTQEVQGGYGGTETRNTTRLPRRNPDCMYFTLGSPGGRGFSSLFDSKTGAAVRFPESARLRRTDDGWFELILPVEESTVIQVNPDYYTKTLGVPFYQPLDLSHFERAPMVWSSWTSYYDAVKEDDIVRNADWLAANLKPYGFDYVQLDDGYDRGPNGEHYWIENWDRKKFPHGPTWLAGYIKSKGLRAGIWVVPNAYAGFAAAHPEWYIHDKQGKVLLDYDTPALDQTNPATGEFLKRMFETLDNWGYDYYKFDGEFAFPKYVPGADRSRLYDKNVDLVESYRQRLALIRATIGPDRFIEGCVAGTPVNGIGYFNSVFNGHDLYNNWQGMYPLFSSISGNAFLNRLLVYVMPGEGIELGLPMTVEEAQKKRPAVVVETARTREDPMTGFGVTDAEARTLVTFVALSGVAYPLASVMPELPPARVELLKKTMPTMPISPADLFSRGGEIHWDTFKGVRRQHFLGNYPELLDVQVNAAAGEYDIAALTNWHDESETRQLDLAEKLSLEPGRPYVVFDFWNQRLLGVYRDRVPVEIAPHDTRVLLVRPAVDHPQLAGLSRHISGAYSIREVRWEPGSGTLRGVSETVPGDPYALWLHVPAGYSVASARALAGADVTVEQHREGESLVLRFAGQEAPVTWEVRFTGAPAAR
ncbi:MAG TPA: alpha-galactosidase [Bryobacteraceae bacterium]|nr:alpha-galactosidase [Bryobacteraceae bacterium]